MSAAMDRKAMIRHYRDRRPTMGIFQVRKLRLGAHPNRQLQADWQALGADAFAFEVLDTISRPDHAETDPRDDLKVLEAMWLEKLAPFGERGYHRGP